eukprot:gene7383-1318_t
MHDSESGGPCYESPDDDRATFGPEGYDFGQPEELPLMSKARVTELLACGRLFRYQGVDDVSLLESEFADYIGLPYTVACNSGGCGLFLALKALGVQPGDPVLVNAHTLCPLGGPFVYQPFAHYSMAAPISLDDLSKRAEQSGASVCIVSYMRGRVPDIDQLVSLASRLRLRLIEDCAHTLGAKWSSSDGAKHYGTFGDVGVWSLQTNKAINAGEGGLIATAHQDVAAYLTVATGSYGHFAKNGASGDTAAAEQVYTTIPNFSMRMAAMPAAVARPQLRGCLEDKVTAWGRHADMIIGALLHCKHVEFQTRDTRDSAAWSSIQFVLKGFSDVAVVMVIDRLAAKGVPLAWFGGPWKGFTSTLKEWQFADPQQEQWGKMPDQESFEHNLMDLPLYHTS